MGANVCTKENETLRSISLLVKYVSFHQVQNPFMGVGMHAWEKETLRLLSL